MTKINIGSVQINNGFSGQFYLPYSIGLLQAFILHNSKDSSRFNFQTTIYKRWLLSDCVEKLKKQDVILFSVYVWNLQISLKIAEELKKINKNCFIVFGGPSVPDNAKEFLSKYKFIDITVHQEGERSLLQILDNFPNSIKENIPGISFFKNNVFFNTKGITRMRNFDGCPSPYLSGTFDSLILENPNEQWLASWETNRGCPFSCTYCDWGSATNSKVARFEMDRIFAELEWFSKMKVEFIFCCDANFGMLPRDYDIVQHAAKLKRETGYPHILSVQSTKNARERAYKVQKALYDSGLSKSINIAMQATDLHTLEAIKRDNISIPDYKELQKRFTADGIPTYVDFILGLPGDTYDKFSNSISDLISSGQHNRIQFNNLSILPNAEMAQKDYIEKYKLETIKAPIVNMHGSLDETPADNIYETQELVISTIDMPREDWVKTRIFASTVEFLFFNKILQIPLLLLYAKHPNISFKLIFEEFIKINDKENFPCITSINKLFIDHSYKIMEGNAEFIYSDKWLKIYWPPGEYAIIKLLSEKIIKDFYLESIKVLTSLMNDKNYNLIIEESCMLNYHLLKKPMINSDIDITLHYNIHEFYLNALSGKNTKIHQGEFNLKIERTKEPILDWQGWARKVLWYGHRRGNYLYEFSPMKKKLAEKN